MTPVFTTPAGPALTHVNGTGRATRRALILINARPAGGQQTAPTTRRIARPARPLRNAELPMDDLSLLPRFLISFGLGLLLGIERQRRPLAIAGMRTFALASVTGTACAMLAQQTGATWLLPAVVLALALVMIAADLSLSPGEQAGQHDTTTSVALVLCTIYGAMLWHGYTQLTVALALLTAALLYFKTALHEVSEHLSHQDMVSFLQFGAIAFIVLPVLPDRDFGPYGVLNPHSIWLMVVRFTGVGLAGYVALRLAGRRRTPLLFGLLGGLISSTATTLAFARAARRNPQLAGGARLVILTANLVMRVRIAGITAVVAPGALRTMLPLLLTALLLGLVPLLLMWRNSRSDADADADAGEVVVGNPLELPAALGFGLIYAATLVITAWINDHVGDVGIYAAAALLGMTDMDAISLSTLQMYLQNQLSISTASVALATAIGANLVFKAALAAIFGGLQLGRHVAVGFLAVLAGLALGIGLFA